MGPRDERVADTYERARKARQRGRGHGPAEGGVGAEKTGAVAPTRALATIFWASCLYPRDKSRHVTAYQQRHDGSSPQVAPYQGAGKGGTPTLRGHSLTLSPSEVDHAARSPLGVVA